MLPEAGPKTLSIIDRLRDTPGKVFSHVQNHALTPVNLIPDFSLERRGDGALKVPAGKQARVKYESIMRCEWKADRRRVLMRALSHGPRGTISVRARDMCTGCVRILAQEVIPQNCDAIFKIVLIFIAARIVWGDRHQACLRLYRHLPPETVFEQALDAESR